MGERVNRLGPRFVGIHTGKLRGPVAEHTVSQPVSQLVGCGGGGLVDRLVMRRSKSVSRSSDYKSTLSASKYTRE